VKETGVYGAYTDKPWQTRLGWYRLCRADG